MTGYTKKILESDILSVQLELRAVNSRYFDVNFRLSKNLNFLESEISTHLRKTLVRGSIACNIFASLISPAASKFELNEAIVSQYEKAYMILQERFGENATFDLSNLLLTSDLFIEKDEPKEDILRKPVMQLLSSAVPELIEMREFEGENILRDFKERMQTIDRMLREIEILSMETRNEIMENYRSRIREFLGDVSIDEKRLHQEIAILVEKRDVTEELVRLKSHYVGMSKMLNDGGIIGKKINFMLQEMGREINTIGSKTSSAVISRLVVDLKDELEKMREQVQNIL